MTRPSTQPIGLKLEETMTSAEIDVELMCPLRTPSFPPGTHEYDPKKHNLIEGVSKCMITREEAQAKFREYHDIQGPHDEVYTDGSKINERVGAAAVVNCHFQDGETTCRQLSKRLPDNSTIFAAEATAITLALDYYRHMDPVQHDVVFYSDSMSCLQAIEGEDTENPLICHIMNLLWALSDKGTCVCFCWVWNCPNMNVTGLHWWSVNIGSGNGLVPSGNKPLPEPVLIQISCRHMVSIGHNELSCICLIAMKFMVHIAWSIYQASSYMSIPSHEICIYVYI